MKNSTLRWRARGPRSSGKRCELRPASRPRASGRARRRSSERPPPALVGAPVVSAARRRKRSGLPWRTSPCSRPLPPRPLLSVLPEALDAPEQALVPVLLDEPRPEHHTLPWNLLPARIEASVSATRPPRQSCLSTLRIRSAATSPGPPSSPLSPTVSLTKAKPHSRLLDSLPEIREPVPAPPPRTWAGTGDKGAPPGSVAQLLIRNIVCIWAKKRVLLVFFVRIRRSVRGPRRGL